MDRLLYADQEGEQLWKEAFDDLQDRSQLIELMLTAEQAGRKNQDDRGVVALKAFLVHPPEALFLSFPMRENREWWHAQIEKHKTMCSFAMLDKCIHGLLGIFMYQKLTWEDTEPIIEWITRCFLMTKGCLPATDCFFGDVPDENFTELRSELEEGDIFLLKSNTLLLALLDPSFDVNTCEIPPLLLVVDENELHGPQMLQILLWIRPEIQDRRLRSLAYNMTAMEYSLVCGDTSFAQILNRHAPQSMDRFFACKNVRFEHKETALRTWEQLRLREIPARFVKRHALQECSPRVACSHSTR